ncbi:Por secretion system C-terminal sorting domain-containing protein [Belliella buryatensis]|uniref:Por secretion system C-terminal sorting domain-containing protein n=2 Tax=Belliella buryatensis TaxID=1500549 RepID=A0A239H792_9BACT|nr:Por secretion system C-terminal sorting domain-containing protein [Belliella buryatensis]
MRRSNQSLKFFMGFILMNFFIATNILAQSNNSRPMPEFEKGEVLFLLKDNVPLKKVDYPNARMGVSQIDQILQEFAVDKLDILFPDLEDYAGKSLPNLRNAYTGKDIQLANLQRTFKVKLPEKDQFKMYDLIQALNESDEVVYAEPNYIFSNQVTEPSFQPLMRNTHPFSKNESFVPNDPLFSSQEGIQRHQIDQVWQTNRGDGKSVIAVIDTGVDYNHPDLAANIWTNPKESANPNNNDTDGNGFVDDFRGWDFINNDNDPMDDNIHGTHVAGILAAVCDNGIGIAGVNCNAKIMPIKALQSSGRGDASTLAQAILYAANNGATVINMSFGGYAESITMRNALAFAYSKAVLVAAAGNDGRCIGPGIGCAPMFPAAYSFVIGVQENGAGQIGNFSNFDQDGPVFSRYPDLWNYEIKATGISVLSTIPNGQYRALNGTSMAAPYVAGAVSLYMEERPEDSKELLFGNLINSAEGGVLKLFASLNTNPEPRLEFVTFEIEDSEGGDGDGRPDAGETIDIIGTVRNTWGQSNGVYMALSFQEFEDTTVVEFLKDTVFLGSISPYALRKNESEPFQLKLRNDLMHDRDISLKVSIWDIGGKSNIEQDLVITVYNRTKVGGLIDRDVTWTADREYLVVENMRIAENATLTIEPGTTVYFDPGKSIDVRGKLVSIGSYNNRIKFIGLPYNSCCDDMGLRGSGLLEIQFSTFQTLHVALKLPINTSFIRDSEIKENYFFGGGNPYIHSEMLRVMFINNFNLNVYNDRSDYSTINDNVFSNNISNWGSFFTFSNYEESLKGNSFYNNVSQNKLLNFDLGWGNSSFRDISGNYFGSVDSMKIQSSVHDFFKNSEKPIALFMPVLIKPSSQSHGHVWKVLINNIDAQDEYQILDPLGVGRHKVEVYFNREMDKTRPPFVSMGVRFPYTQTAISQDGAWNEAGNIYTAYLEVGVGTGDGINRLRVEGARDLEWFDIPIEDSRFNVLVDAAGSLSGDFFATPGLGRINLDWASPEEEVSDLLGYNMYRYQYIQVGDTLLPTDTLQINRQLLNQEHFEDLEVIPGKQYFYGYKIVRTNLTESDFSKIISAVALTAEKGDVNGDLKVDVLDVVSTISHIIGENPRPFIDEAADINEDGTINVLDVVQIISKILNPSSASTGFGSLNLAKATLLVDEEGMVLDSNEPIAGLQLEVKNWKKGTPYTVHEAFRQFESIQYETDSSLVLLLFNFGGNVIPSGKIPLLSFEGAMPEVLAITTAGERGKPILTTVNYRSPEQQRPEHFQVFQNSPNPFSQSTTIHYTISAPSDVTLLVYSIMGETLITETQSHQSAGKYSFEVQGNGMKRGVYLYRVLVKGADGVQMSSAKKMMYIP